MASLHAPGAAVSVDELAELEDILEDELPAYLEDLAQPRQRRLRQLHEGRRRRGRALDGAVPRAARGDGRGPTRRARSATRSSARSTAGRVAHASCSSATSTRSSRRAPRRARPFRIEAGIAHGPGVTDMKSGLLAGLYALLALRALGDRRRRRGRRRCRSSGSCSSPTPTRRSARRARRPHIRELALEADVCFVLECARANGDIVSARKGTVDLRLTVHGRAAHAGVEPEKGRSAVLEAAHQTIAIQALNGRWPGVTVNVGVIHGGTRPNVVAEEAALEVDLRATSRDTSRRPRPPSGRSPPSTTVPDTTVTVEEAGRHWPMEKLERSGRLVEHAVGTRRAARLPAGRLRDRRRVRRQHDLRAGRARPSTASDRSAATTTRRPSTSRSTRSCRGRRCSPALLLAVARDPLVASWRPHRA